MFRNGKLFYLPILMAAAFLKIPFGVLSEMARRYGVVLKEV